MVTIIAKVSRFNALYLLFNSPKLNRKVKLY